VDNPIEAVRDIKYRNGALAVKLKAFPNWPLLDCIGALLREYLAGVSRSISSKPESLRLNLLGTMGSGLKHSSTLNQARA